MRLAPLLLISGLLVGSVAAETGHADSRSAGLGVSVVVTRSCGVTVSAPAIGVTCRAAQPSTVQVRIGKGQPSLRTLQAPSGQSRRVSTTVPLRPSNAGSGIVTVNF